MFQQLSECSTRECFSAPQLGVRVGGVRRRRAGFTLIEIIAVFVLVGAVTAIAIRSVGDTLRRDRLVKSMAILSADLDQAFAIAARQRTPVRLMLDSTTLSFAVVERSDTTMKYRTRQFKSGDLALDFMQVSARNIDVLPSGLSSDTLSLKLGIYSKNNTTYTRTLRMTRAGMVRIQ